MTIEATGYPSNSNSRIFGPDTLKSISLGTHSDGPESPVTWQREGLQYFGFPDRNGGGVIITDPERFSVQSTTEALRFETVSGVIGIPNGVMWFFDKETDRWLKITAIAEERPESLKQGVRPVFVARVRTYERYSDPTWGTENVDSDTFTVGRGRKHRLANGGRVKTSKDGVVSVKTEYGKKELWNGDSHTECKPQGAGNPDLCHEVTPEIVGWVVVDAFADV